MKAGVSRLEYEEMLVEQNGVCAICHRPSDSMGRRLCVDHDHATGRTRGLLCSTCNWNLERHGASRKDPVLAERAREYLERAGDADF